MLLFAAAPANAESVNQVVALNLAARGGLARLERVQTQRLAGTISFAPGSETPFTVELKRGGRIREEVGVPGGTLVQLGDGHAGWRMSPTDSNRVHELSAAELKNLAGSADFDGPLVNWKAKGNHIEMVGRDSVNGHEAWHLNITQRDSTTREDYIDCASHLELKWAGTISDGGKTYRVESFFSDYHDVNGVQLAHHIDSNTLGTDVKQVLVFKTVEVDVPIDDSRFARPSPPAAAR